MDINSISYYQTYDETDIKFYLADTNHFMDLFDDTLGSMLPAPLSTPCEMY